MIGLLPLVIGVVVLNVYALVLVLIRGPLYRVRVYRPMLLNLALSAAPVVVLFLTLVTLSTVGMALPQPVGIVTILFVGGLAWLLLLPNSAYLVTELNFSHRRAEEDVPLWFDIVATLALALSGVMNTLLNVFFVQVIFVAVSGDPIVHPFRGSASWLLAGIILFLTTIGIYLGRYLRFNTWDVVNPVRFGRKLFAHFAEPGRVGEAVGFCTLHTLLLAILYAVVAAPLAIAL